MQIPKGEIQALGKSHLPFPAGHVLLYRTALPGEVCWHELLSDDPVRALVFYGQVLGWAKSGEHDRGAMGTCTLFGTTGGNLGGMRQRPAEAPASAWIYYFQVADVDTAIARTTAKGGRLHRGPMPVPGGARVALLVDPQGAVFAVQRRGEGRQPAQEVS